MKLFKNLWWIKYYKTYITKKEVNKGRCTICEGFPDCTNNGCPCNYNQRLVKKF